jgi:hypothetical protein
MPKALAFSKNREATTLLVARLGDRQVVAVSREGGGDFPGPFGINHFVTSTAVPDHSPKIRTTIEIAALRAPATTIGTCRGDGRMRVKASSALVSASAKRAMDRARTYEGIADAMANQWSGIL